MTTSSASNPGVVAADHVVLGGAVAAYLGRYRGASRLHTESDLRIFLTWCIGHDLDPLSAARVDIERYVRWLQDVRRYQPPPSPDFGTGHYDTRAGTKSD